jgi:hypothetical protein
MSRDFRRAVEEIEGVLADFTIPVTELIAGGGGEARPRRTGANLRSA